MNRKSLLSITILSTVIILWAPLSRAQDLAERIQAIEEEIDALRTASRHGRRLSEMQAAQVRDVVRDVLIDSSTRTSLLQGPAAAAGYDKHPFIESSDGNFRLEFQGRVQVRYAISVQDDAPRTDSTRGGVELRRARWYLTGHVIDPSLTFKLQGNFHRSGGAELLEDAFLRKTYDNGLHVQAGQFRPGFMRESNTSTARLLAVERSLVHSALGVARTQGVEVGREADWYRVRLMVHDGDGMANSPALGYDTEFAVTGHAQVLLAGDWDQFKDFTSWRGEDFAAMIGGGVHYQKGEFGTTDGPEADDIRFTIDGSLEFGGSNLFGAFTYRNLSADGAADVDQLAALIQGGVFITDADELFARYEWGDGDLPGEDHLHLITLGLTHYFSKHDLKWTSDVGYAFNAVSPFWASSGADWRADPAGRDGQIVVRSQLQLQF